RQSSQFSEITLLQIVLRDQRLQIDEIGIASERRKTLIRGVAHAGGTERADLPVLQTGIHHEIDEMPCFTSKCSDPCGARETRWMQHDTGCPILQPIEKRCGHNKSPRTIPTKFMRCEKRRARCGQESS